MENAQEEGDRWANSGPPDNGESGLGGGRGEEEERKE